MYLAFNHPLYSIEPLPSLKYEIVPRSRHFYEKRGQSPSAVVLPKKIDSDDHLLITLQAYNTTFHLDLEPNIDLFHPTAEEHRHAPDFIGAYKGKVQSGGGWARFIIRYLDNQPVIEGGFRYENDLYHVKAAHQYNLVKRSTDPVAATNTPMVIYRDSDTLLTKRDATSHQCGFDNMMMPRVEQGGLLTKRFEQGCPITKKINYMGAAADCTYVQYYKSRDAARVQIINDFNMASAVFEDTFNVALGLINITIMDPTCPTNINPSTAWNRACNANYSLSDRLSDFSLWRSHMKDDGAGLWHLMTNCPTGVEVGLAWLKQLCTTSASTQKTKDGKLQYVSGAGVSAITRDEWKVVAHEIGHGFGAIHDCASDSCPCEGDACQCCPANEDSCPSEGFLMSPISNISAKHFSPCSIKTICSAFPTTGHCLSDPLDHARSIYELNVCGNGIMEAGEECDTGGIDSDCCDSKTCKLKEHAVCEDFNGSCCHKCQIQPTTHMCRPAATPCDISEHCTGHSASCPDDVYIPDGNTCDDGKRCASGQCTSRDAQCLSRGFVMNITESCRSNNEECKMLCNKPDGKCLLFSGNFIDGTPCGRGGSCVSGACSDGGTTASMRWVREHQHIMIPVCIVAFLLVCAGVFAMAWFGCCGRKGYKDRKQGDDRQNAIDEKVETQQDGKSPKPDSSITMVASTSANTLVTTSPVGTTSSGSRTVNNDNISKYKP
ncbi:hypothetical protein HPULCUR_005708 [Helicostylum pulchrum]|uniref:Uncharacterized protein n=1 Tax=Helicostylum pulchrum TaxID=562976 RepID=A0ABP9XZU5_9FUNG